MANLKDSPHFDNHDDYYTRKKAWEDIKEFIPEDKIIWEACLLNSNEQSKKYLEELGFNVVGNKNVDIFDSQMGDVIITNIPFSTDIKQKILKRLNELDQPFIIIMNSMNVFTRYFREIFSDKDINFIIPSYKIHYDKFSEGKLVEQKNNTSFYSWYVCYKIPKVKKNIWI
tara:strand:- start:269 stop:781 length:513 start_codon:yes stop_codon:yes gene_type:complete